ncbi:MAG: hypothetical protein SD837_21995 [Candidatus Electrothrix scaldis]|nr:MAG: hypothetical protein SD837_21995 [Candidatus Electrothrix sp. GW3-3]
MVQKRQYPEEGKELSKITRVILNDLKGRREIQQEFRKKKQTRQRRSWEIKEEPTDHTEWMPKQVPQAMKQAIKETEKQKPKPKAPKPKVSVRKKKDSFEYVVQLKNGKTMKAKRVMIKRDKVILFSEEMEIAVQASAVQWIKETRVRMMVLQSGTV